MNHIGGNTPASLFYIHVQIGTHATRALVDTGAFNSALSLTEFLQIFQTNPHAVTSREKVQNEHVRVANGSTARVVYRAKINLHVLGRDMIEEFMIINQLNNPILGISFFKNNDITIDCKTHRLHFPDMTAQLNEIVQKDGKIKKLNKKNTYPVQTCTKITIQPNEQVIVNCFVDGLDETEPMRSTCGIIEPSLTFERRTDLCVTSSISKADKDGRFPIGLINLAGNPVTVNPKAAVGKLKILSPQQIDFLTPIDPGVLATVMEQNHTQKEVDRALTAIYGLNGDIQPKKTRTKKRRKTTGSLNSMQEREERKFWFATPENCKDPSKLRGIEKRIYEQLCEFKRLESRNPQNSEEEREEFLAKFSWLNSVLSPAGRFRIEALLVKYYKIFAVHRFDIGGNQDFKVILTPEHKDPIYTQGNQVPVQLQELMSEELAFQTYFDIIKAVGSSKYASPVFAQKKPNGSLRILIDLRRINYLLRHDYDQHNFPLSSLDDVGIHLAGKKLYCKLDASQAYHALFLGNEESKQLLGFNFQGRTYVYQRLAQGLSRSVTAFSSFMRKYLDPCIAADKCFQYVDDIGTAAYTEDELIENLEEIFICISKAGLRLSIKKCEFGLPKINFLGNTITSQGISPNKEKVATFLETMKMPRNARQVKRLIGFLQFFRNFLPNLSIKLIPFYHLLKNNVEFKIEEEHKKNFEILKKDLAKSTETYLRFPKANLQYVIIADASYYGAGFVLMVEDYCNDEEKEHKILAPVSFGSKVFNPSQLKLSIFAKEFLAVHYAFEKFAHILWGSTYKHTLVLTDNKALAMFFQAKTIPATLWSFLDRVMSFSFVLGHIPGSANAAADFLSRLQLEPAQKFKLKMKDSIPLHRIELDVMAQTPPLLNSLQINSIMQCDDWIMTDRERGGEPPDAVLINPEQQVIVGLMAAVTPPLAPEITAKIWFTKSGQMNSLHESNPLDHFDMSDRRHPMKWRQEQGRDPMIQKAMKWVRLNQKPTIHYATYEEDKYLKQLPRLTIKDQILYRKFYDHTGKVQCYQIVVPRQLRKELLYRIHNTKFMAHKGISKTITEFRQKFYFPGFTEYLVEYIKNCQSCVQIKPIRAAQITPPLQEMMSKVSYPGNMMQVDIVGAMNMSGGYKYILTAIDVFSRYLFAIPMAKQSAMAVAKALVGIFMRHAYLPDTIVTDCGTAFTSALIHELAEILEIEIKHASVKHSQTMGTIERSHASLKKVLKIYESNQGANWHNYVDYAVFCHNTSYHASIGCTPSLVFHGREPITPLDLRFGKPPIARHNTQYDYTKEVQQNLTDISKNVKDNAIKSYQKYRALYDRKACAEPLKLHSYCYLLNPKLTTQNMTTGKHMTKWLPLYRVEKVLTNMNYIVRKTATHLTQCVHRIRLRPIIPQTAFRDFDWIDPSRFQKHQEQLNDVEEPQAFDDAIIDLAKDDSGNYANGEVLYTPYLYIGIPTASLRTKSEEQARGYMAAPPSTDSLLLPSVGQNAGAHRIPGHSYAAIAARGIPPVLPQSDTRMVLRPSTRRQTGKRQCTIQLPLNTQMPDVQEREPNEIQWPNTDRIPILEPATITEIPNERTKVRIPQIKIDRVKIPDISEPIKIQQPVVKLDRLTLPAEIKEVPIPRMLQKAAVYEDLTNVTLPQAAYDQQIKFQQPRVRLNRMTLPKSPQNDQGEPVDNSPNWFDHVIVDPGSSAPNEVKTPLRRSTRLQEPHSEKIPETPTNVNVPVAPQAPKIVSRTYQQKRTLLQPIPKMNLHARMSGTSDIPRVKQIQKKKNAPEARRHPQRVRNPPKYFSNYLTEQQEQNQ